MLPTLREGPGPEGPIFCDHTKFDLDEADTRSVCGS